VVTAKCHGNACTLNKWMAGILPDVSLLMEQMAGALSTLEALDTQLAAWKRAN
jgi:hypothetical protein